MVMIDRDLNIVWCNDTAKSAFSDGCMGKKCHEILCGRQWPCEPYPCYAIQTFRDGNIHSSDAALTNRDGQEVSFHCVANVALRDADGSAAAVLTILRDITDRKRAKKTPSWSRRRSTGPSSRTPWRP